MLYPTLQLVLGTICVIFLVKGFLDYRGSFLTDCDSTIFVLTDTPDLYGEDLHHHDKPPIFVKDIKVLMSQLKNIPVAGLVLEVPKVMAAPRKDRDRLFNYAGSFPVLRTKPDKKRKLPNYLDPRDCFFSNLEAAIGKRCRNHERISVKIECAFSREDDPSMAELIKATILDISPGGCFINTRKEFNNESFMHLRIPELENSRPIYSSIRWTRMEEVEADLSGLGVMFIDLADDQLENILALQLTAQVRD